MPPLPAAWRGGGAGAQWGNVWTKCTASLEDANKFFFRFSARLFLLFFFFLHFFSMLSLQLPTLCLKCCWQTTRKCVCVCACCVCCLPADVFHKKSKWQVCPAAARRFTHFTQLPKLCRLEMWVRKNQSGKKKKKRLKCKWGKQIVGQPRLVQTDWLAGWLAA